MFYFEITLPMFLIQTKVLKENLYLQFMNKENSRF